MPKKLIIYKTQIIFVYDFRKIHFWPKIKGDDLIFKFPSNLIITNLDILRRTPTSGDTDKRAVRIKLREFSRIKSLIKPAYF